MALQQTAVLTDTNVLFASSLHRCAGLRRSLDVGVADQVD